MEAVPMRVDPHSPILKVTPVWPCFAWKQVGHLALSRQEEELTTTSWLVVNE